MIDATNRTTWQISRKTTILPTGVAGHRSPPAALQVLQTIVGSQIPATSVIMESLGAPVVSIDAIARVPNGSVVQEGDSIMDLERGALWQAVKVKRFPNWTLVGLKTVQNKSSQ